MKTTPALPVTALALLATMFSGPPAARSAQEAVSSDAALLLEQAIQLQQTNAELKAARVLLEQLRDAPDTPEIIRQEARRRLQQMAALAASSGAKPDEKTKPAGAAEQDPPIELFIPPHIHTITVSGETVASAPSLLPPNLNFSWNTPPQTGTKPSPYSLPGGPGKSEPNVPWNPPSGRAEDPWAAAFSTLPAPFSSDLRKIEGLSLTEVSAEDLRNAACNAIARKLHPDAGFLPNDPSGGTPEKPVTGVGVLLSTDHAGILCREILPDSPAARAGIPPGSELTKVNGQTVFALGGTMEKVVKAVRGPEGSEVSLTLIPPGESEKTITLKRSLVTLRPPPLCEPLARNPDGFPKWMLADGVLGIQLNSIQPGSAEGIRQLLEDPSHQPPRALVLDLSGNGGGSVDEVPKILELFLTKGALYSRREKGGSIAVALKLPWTSPPFPNLPMAVLTSSGTAAGAEVMAAAFQDHQRAVIIGQRTLGRTTIFQSVPFQNGMMRVPVAELCRADGRSIEWKPGMTEKDSWGVIPDILVPETPTASFNIRFSKRFEPFENVESVAPQGPDPVFTDKAEHSPDSDSAQDGTSSTPATPNSKMRVVSIPHTPPRNRDRLLPQPDVLKTALKYLHEKLEAK